MTLPSHSKTNPSIKNQLLLEVIRALMTGSIRPAASESNESNDLDHCVAACELAMDLRNYIDISAAGEHDPSNDVVDEDDGVDAPRNSAICVGPARCVGKRLITIRENSHSVTITFTATLARECRLPQYGYAAITINEAEGRVDFEFTNDPATAEGTFSLGFNGGSSREKNSPSRILQIRPEAVPWLRAGHYTPEITRRDGQLKISLRVRGSSSQRVEPSTDRKAQRWYNA